MTETANRLIARIRDLEDQLEAEFARRRADFRFRVEKHRVIFEEAVMRRQQALKQRLWPYVRGARPLVILTAPVIYSIILPFVLLDLFVTVYQAVCFPVYGIAKARRRDYIILDHQHLAYLNGLEKLNCAYCSYANGLIAYVREIAARTERHWCPIKHARRMQGPHPHYPEFAEYGDAETYRKIIAQKPSYPEKTPPGAD